MKRLMFLLIVVLFIGLTGCSEKETTAEVEGNLEIDWNEFVEHYNDKANVYGIDKLDKDKSDYLFNNTAITENDGVIKNIYKAPSPNEKETEVILETLTHFASEEDSKKLESVNSDFKETVEGTKQSFSIKPNLDEMDILILFGEDDYTTLIAR